MATDHHQDYCNGISTIDVLTIDVSTIDVLTIGIRQVQNGVLYFCTRCSFVVEPTNYMDTLITHNIYDPSAYLSWSNINVHDPIKTTVFGVTLKQSKTDPFCKGVNLFLGRMSSALCLVVALLNYLVTRGLS